MSVYIAVIAHYIRWQTLCRSREALSSEVRVSEQGVHRPGMAATRVSGCRSTPMMPPGEEIHIISRASYSYQLTSDVLVHHCALIVSWTLERPQQQTAMKLK